MANLPIPELVTHTRKVQSLYKRAVRNIESFVDRREVARYYITLIRERFDKNADIQDIRVAKELLSKGEQELRSSLHWHIRQFPESPGGTAHLREVPSPDWVLDYWHPLEKKQYPEYFKTRENRKIEFFKFWEKQSGKLKLEGKKKE